MGELPGSEGMWENCPLGWVKKKASGTLAPLDFLLQRKRLWLWASEPVRPQPQGIHRFREARRQFCRMRGSRLTGGRKGFGSSGLRFGRDGFSEEVMPQPVLKAMRCAEGAWWFSPDGPAGSAASIWPAEGAERLPGQLGRDRLEVVYSVPDNVPGQNGSRRPLVCKITGKCLSVCSEENAKAGGCSAFPLLLSQLGARMTGREHAHKGPELTTPDSGLPRPPNPALAGFRALAQHSPPLGTSTPSAVLLSAAT
nr:ORCTL2S hypothetical protein [Homo sapiens]AAC17497.1 p27-BWR1B [Homo sapiens]